MRKIVFVIFCYTIATKVCTVPGAAIDAVECGKDRTDQVDEGDVDVVKYPWLGMLYYLEFGDSTDLAGATPVVLIHEEFLLSSAFDIGPMPKDNFRSKTRVILGEDSPMPGRRVRNYVLHPEYGDMLCTVAIIQLRDPVRRDLTILQKEVIPVIHVPARMCKEFYIAANLYEKKMRPPHVVCAVSLYLDKICVLEPGAALVTRDVWGRWTLLGLGVKGPGCSAPSRYLDMLSYYPWVHDSLSRFSRITISKINNKKYVLRSTGSGDNSQRYGDCDPEEKSDLIYRESMVLQTDNNKHKIVRYNLTILQHVEVTCFIMQLSKASGWSALSVKHSCYRANSKDSAATQCYNLGESKYEVYLFVSFDQNCILELLAFGRLKNMTLIDRADWHREEATYYEDLAIDRTEYRGGIDLTLAGFEPLDDESWVPEFDFWTTTEANENLWSSTTGPPARDKWQTAEHSNFR